MSSRLERVMEATDYLRREWQSPNYKKPFFNCPHCGALAQQDWPRLLEGDEEEEHWGEPFIGCEASVCVACGETSLWVRRHLVYPMTSNAPQPHPEMPENAKSFYLEARAVLSISPHASAALARLSLEEICKDQGAIGGDLAKRVRNLVERESLSEHTQRMLQVVRCFGNDAVHNGGQILSGERADDADDAARLLMTLNDIVEEVIARPRRVREQYERIPENKRGRMVGDHD